jgi:transposase
MGNANTPRRNFDKQFKLDAVRLITEGGRKVSEVARDLGISENALHNWRNQFKEQGTDSFPGKGRLTPAEDELRRLQRELANVKEERDILKKALGIFSRPRP